MVELAIRTAMLKLGGRLLEDLLGIDGGHRGQRTGCGNGHDAEFISYRDKTIDTVVDPVQLHRAWYHCAACGHGLAPRDGELGVAGVSLSPGLAKMNARAASAVPFAPARRLLAELAGIELTVKRVERSAGASGATAAQAISALADAIRARQVVPLPPAGPLPDKLYIAVDGTGIPVIGREAEGRQGKADDGKARTREIKLACLFTQTKLDDDGKPTRDPASTTRLATFEPAEQFGALLDAEARRRGIEHIRQPVVLGDGAAWIWNLAGQYFPAATQIVDLYHAREHLHDLANLAARLLAGHRDDWLAARLEERDDGDVNAILAAGRALDFIGCCPPTGTRPWPTSSTTPTGCATATSASSACSPALASSRPAASQLSGSVRAFQRLGYDETTLEIYDEAMRKGDLLLQVPVTPAERRRIVALLQDHHVHDLGYFGPGTFEQFPILDAD